jgi:hypothetical protein
MLSDDAPGIEHGQKKFQRRIVKAGPKSSSSQ